MFVTKDKVKEMTGYDVAESDVYKAQVLIEMYVGKTEAEVEDPNDQALLARATALQTAYMHDHPEIAYEQAAVGYSLRGADAVSFDPTLFSPMLSPWAAKACQRLTWRTTRSVRTGPTFSRPRVLGWEYA